MWVLPRWRLWFSERWILWNNLCLRCNSTMRGTAFSIRDTRQGQDALRSMLQNSALQMGHSGRGDWAWCSPTKPQDNDDPAFFPASRILSIDTPVRTDPLNPPNSLHRLSNFPNSSKNREMLQSCVREGTNSFDSSSAFNNTIYFNNTNSFNNTTNGASFNHVSDVNNGGSVDERDKILEWLSPLEPRIWHHDIRAHRVEDVRDWLLRTEGYWDWFDRVRGRELPGSASPRSRDKIRR